MPPALAIRGVTKRYRAGVPGCSAAVDALREVTLEVHEGETVGILGPCGAGKTTLMLCAAGLLRPSDGAVEWFGMTRMIGARPPGVAYVPANGSFYAFLTVREAVEHHALLRDVDGADRGARVAEALARVALDAQASTRVSRLSAGARRRLGLAQALITRPRLLLLDEPFADLDAGERRIVREALSERAGEGAAVLVATGDAPALVGLASRTIALVAGAIVDTRARGAPVARALELDVATPERVLPLLSRCVRGAMVRNGRLLLPLADASSEELLAHCRALGIAVERSRIVAER